MSTPQALTVALDLNSGPIEYRVYEDYLEIFSGGDDREMSFQLNLTMQCVRTLASICEQAMPALLANTALIAQGQVAQCRRAPREYTVQIGSTCSIELPVTAPRHLLGRTPTES